MKNLNYQCDRCGKDLGDDPFYIFRWKHRKNEDYHFCGDCWRRWLDWLEGKKIDALKNIQINTNM